MTATCAGPVYTELLICTNLLQYYVKYPGLGFILCNTT